MCVATHGIVDPVKASHVVLSHRWYSLPASSGVATSAAGARISRSNNARSSGIAVRVPRFHVSNHDTKRSRIPTSRPDREVSSAPTDWPQRAVCSRTGGPLRLANDRIRGSRAPAAHALGLMRSCVAASLIRRSVGFNDIFATRAGFPLLPGKQRMATEPSLPRELVVIVTLPLTPELSRNSHSKTGRAPGRRTRRPADGSDHWKSLLEPIRQSPTEASKRLWKVNDRSFDTAYRAGAGLSGIK